MQRNEKLYLSICDYNKNVVCDLYDNQSDISGQATDVVIVKERNGWKELTFNIPSSCMGENGLEENYRINYLIAEYRIKAVVLSYPDSTIIGYFEHTFCIHQALVNGIIRHTILM